MSTEQSLHASRELQWPVHFSNLDEKQEVARRAASQVKDGEVIGIGSGSSSYLVLWAIGARVKADGLSIKVVTSSYETDTAAATLGIPTLALGTVRPVWGVDGADEVDPAGRMLKGRGGAMFKEKLLWYTCREMYLAVDPSKYVERLGQGFPIPIEVNRCAVELTAAFLDEAGSSRHQLRVAEGKDGPVITESGNLIIDAWFEEIPDGLSARLKALPGVIETGLFEGYRYQSL